MAILSRCAMPSLDRPFDHVDQIVMDLAGVLLLACGDEGFAETSRAAIIHREHSIAAVGQPLMIAAIAENIARPWTAVHDEHHRQRFWRAVTFDFGRQRQVRNKGEAVARFGLDGMHRREPICFQLRPRRKQLD